MPSLSAITVVALAVAACGSSSTQSSDVAQTAASSAAATDVTEVVIEDNRGSVTVPYPATSVIVTDNRLFEALEAWGVSLAAAPEDIMATTSAYKTDSSVVNLGNHREPDLEAAVAVEPDLIINGQRFQDFYTDFQTLTPDAALVDIDIRDNQPFENCAVKLACWARSSASRRKPKP